MAETYLKKILSRHDFKNASTNGYKHSSKKFLKRI
jgi:hypothetical protein